MRDPVRRIDIDDPDVDMDMGCECSTGENRSRGRSPSTRRDRWCSSVSSASGAVNNLKDVFQELRAKGLNLK